MPKSPPLTQPTPTATDEFHEPLMRAESFLDQGKPADALDALRGTPSEHPRWLWLWASTLATLGRHDEAIAPLSRLLEVDPANSGASELLAAIRLSLSPPADESSKRSWNTSLPRETLDTIQNALHRYTYAGIPMLKNPFDLAIYSSLLHNLKPALIIELGSKAGASALWLAHQCDAFRLDTRIISIDVIGVEGVRHPRLDFLQGDARRLQSVLTPADLERTPRPWLVIDDADHAYETCSAIGAFFEPLLQPGDYLVVEDGIISDLAPEAFPDATSGPHRMIRELVDRPNPLYEIDQTYCDMFGHNMTWCTNGFLRRVR